MASARRDGHHANITPSEDGLADWSQEDIAYLLETGELDRL